METLALMMQNKDKWINIVSRPTSKDPKPDTDIQLETSNGFNIQNTILQTDESLAVSMEIGKPSVGRGVEGSEPPISYSK